MTLLQTEFCRALLDPAAARPEGLTDGQGRPAGRRFDVYRNNVAVSLTEALETAFPVVRKLVGPENFKVLSGAFLRRHPPASPLMMFYGTEMPDFLTAFGPTANTGYLPDMAKLEIALRESYHAADAEAAEASHLDGFSPEALMALQTVLAPSHRLVRSNWPIHSIWRFNTEPGAPKPAMAAEDVLILRPEMDPEPHLLPPGGGTFIASLERNATLGDAYEAAISTAPEFDLSAVLALLIGEGAIIRIGVRS